MLGHKIIQVFAENHSVSATARSAASVQHISRFIDTKQIYTEVDAENIQTVEAVIKDAKPDVIINCIGIVKQLPTSRNVVKTLRVNSIFPHLLNEAAQNFKARLVTISTDCVFDGKKGFYNESDISNAADVYGKSKNLGEVEADNCLTVRTSIIGRELETAHSLVEWFLSNRGGSVKGFARAIYSGFPTIVLADIIRNLIERHPRLSGLYHVSSEPINKYELLCLIKKAYGLQIEIQKDERFEIDRSLDSSRFRSETNFHPPDWTEMIERMAADSLPYEEIRKHSAGSKH